jgi:hypothetical protein
LCAAALACSAAFVVVRCRKARKENPPLGRFVEVNGVRLHYVEQGAGTPIVMLHGNGSLMQDFLTSGLVRMAARKHRVIVFDRPGYGWSERPRSRIWTPGAQADLFSAATRKLGIVRTHVLGHRSLRTQRWRTREIRRRHRSTHPATVFLCIRLQHHLAPQELHLPR